MITHILSLTRWEWFKLRRRRMPWILLIIAVALAQLIFWSTYAFFQSGAILDQSSISFSETDAQGNSVEIELTCRDVPDMQEGAIPPEIEQLPSESRDEAMRAMEGFAQQCESVLEDFEALRGGLLLPRSINGALESVLATFGVILVMVLAASTVGTEYGWGTLRTVLVRGVGRWQLLASKTLLLGLLCVGVSLVVSLITGVGSLIASLTFDDGGLAGSGEWSVAAITFGKVIYMFMPYIALAILFTVLTSSSGVGISIGVGYYVVESIVVGILINFDWFESVSNFVLGHAASGWLSADGSVRFGPPGVGTVPDALHGALVMLGYTLILGSLAFWQFQRKDIAGAKGG